jgi:hypothetical protein
VELCKRIPTTIRFDEMKKKAINILLFILLTTLYPLLSYSLPAEDVQLVMDAQYFQVAKKMIQEAKSSIQVMMFEMGYYEKFPDTPSNLLVKELIHELLQLFALVYERPCPGLRYAFGAFVAEALLRSGTWK